MPVLQPTGLYAWLINDLVNEVIIRAENKTSDSLTRAPIWIRDSLLEITSNPDFRNEFDQLELYGAPYNLTPQVQEYIESNLLPNATANVATLDILIWQDPPTNSIRRKLGQSHYQKADNFQPTFSLPTEWYRFSNLIGFTPVPDKAYLVQTRMLQQHPVNDANLPQTQILIPRDWNEVLIWAAVERAFMEYLEYEKAQKVHILLYGDPKHPERPGIIEGRKKRREMESHRTEEPLRPVYRSCCYGA
jgi:hypothetical protein